MIDHHKWLIRAYECATKSPDPRTQVGTVLLDSYGNLLRAGWNRPTKGSENWKECGAAKKAVMTHAERSCLFSSIKSDGAQAVRGATIYITGLPCWDCANAIIEFEVGTVVYHKPIMSLAIGKEEYFRESESMLLRKGITVISVDIPLEAPPILYDGELYYPNVY